jgi:hypothetical protein
VYILTLAQETLSLSSLSCLVPDWDGQALLLGDSTWGAILTATRLSLRGSTYGAEKEEREGQFPWYEQGKQERERSILTTPLINTEQEEGDMRETEFLATTSKRKKERKIQ